MGIKVGLIGAGSISFPHLLGYVKSQYVDEVVLCDQQEESARRRQKEYRSLVKTITTDMESILNDREVAVVDICVPPYLHHEIAIQAFQKGKDVIVEKPVALDVEKADQMIAAAERFHKRLLVAHNQRFMPTNIRIKELLDGGEIGRPFLAQGCILGDELDRMNQENLWKGTWDKAGGGVLADSGIHYIDIFQYFFGPVTSVSSCCKKILVKPKQKAEDNVLLNLEFVSGVMAQLLFSYSMTEWVWQETKAIYGTSGSIIVNDNDSQPLKLVKAKKKEQCPDGCIRCLELDEKAVTIPALPEGMNMWLYSVASTIETFIQCLRENQVCPVTPKEARANLQVVEAAYVSARNGVRVSLDTKI